jgi:phenylalanine-4-hydroxylase
MELNTVLEKLPKHLLNIVIDQPYINYTAQDQAVWRYVMKQNINYLPKVAHESYLKGLERTGVSIDSIPNMYGMNRILQKIGWAAVAVDGFIPPAAFMEFQAYNVLVIAADIRPIEQIEYTPAPDIIHEAAGHAPIIADPDYADYLRLFGEIGHKAFSSAHDYKVYEAIRHLSILKADPYTPKADIENAEQEMTLLEQQPVSISEMSLIRNLHWWTVEYGLIGDLANPKIYGAGLLSSIGESFSSLQPVVKKLPYTIEAAKQGFDITNRQPQLFVTPSFEHLSNVLDEFACQMALRRGGLYGIKKAIESENTATCEYSSGLQVSGTFTQVIEWEGMPVYLKTSGPTALSFQFNQLEGHGKDYHVHGFGSPIGKLKGFQKPLEYFTESELHSNGFSKGKNKHLEFESGLMVKGNILNILTKKGKNLIISFADCTVSYQDQVLFEPAWGIFDMAVGELIYSAFSGPADPKRFEFSFNVPEEKTHKIIYSDKAKQLHALYQQVRDIREGKKEQVTLEKIYSQVIEDYPREWLLISEIFELSKNFKYNGLRAKVESNLLGLKDNNPDLSILIENGMKVYG